jgi:hypothetical protein
MPIANVALSNTFNEFRSTTNSVITEVNKLSDGTAVLVVDAITANTFTGVSSDLNISANTGTDVVSLVTESLRIVGTNGISTSIASSSNTINVDLNTSGVTSGTYGSASQVPTLVIDAQGRVTSAANVNVAGVSAFNYHSGNANFQIATADGGSFTASIGQDLGTSASVTFQDLSVTGNVTFTGNVISVTANNFVVEDNIIQIGKNNLTDVVDLGFLGHYYSGANLHAGLFRDATDGVWKFFDNYTVEPGSNTNIDVSGSGFRFANLTANNITANGTFYGSLTGVAAVATVANTSTLTADNTTNATNYLTFVNAATGNQALRTDIGLSFNPSTNTLTTSKFTLPGSTSGNITIQATATAGTTTITFPATTGTVITTGDSGTVTSTMIADGTIVNGDISASAAIATSKISGLATSATTDTTNANNISSGTLPGARGVTAGSASASFITYNGTTKTSGQFDGGSTAPTNTTRLNYDGNLYATNFFGNGSNLTGISSGLTVSDDTSTNATRYLTFTDQTSGTETTAFISSTKLYFNPSTGTLNATVFNSLSDETLKKNITKITNATDLISLLDGVEFEWAENGTKSSGLIAQWIEKIVPHLVSSGDSEIKTVNYSGLIAYLVEAVKELNERVKKLESK